MSTRDAAEKGKVILFPGVRSPETIKKLESQGHRILYGPGELHLSAIRARLVKMVLPHYELDDEGEPEDPEELVLAIGHSLEGVLGCGADVDLDPTTLTLYITTLDDDVEYLYSFILPAEAFGDTT